MLNGHLVHLALGSNLGNRVGHIYTALNAINEYAAIETTSFLYETDAAFYTDQPNFLNAVCKATTHLSPMELLYAIEDTMDKMGRKRTIPNGPRVIDIDILLYEDLQFESPELIIPHPGIAERDFVLEPLCDVAKTARHPVLNSTFFDLWRRLGTPNLQKVMPVGDRVWPWNGSSKTYVMGVLNREKDLAIDSLEYAVSSAEQMVANGADLLDIDAHMTMPQQTPLTVEQEIGRIVPIVEAITRSVDVPVSVNTYQYRIAQAAVEAGAQFLNYRCNLQYAEQICSLIITKQVPLVLTYNPKNSRDYNSQSNLSTQSATEYTQTNGHFIDEVRHELRQMRIVAKANVVPRWLLIQNPGLSLMSELGEARQLMQNLNELVQTGYPILIDPSRSRLRCPDKCTEELIALTTVAALNGAMMIRTFDVKATNRALRITNELRQAQN